MALGHHHHQHEQGVATSKDLHHPGRKGALAGFVALAMNALTVASSWGMAAMGGLGIFYSAFEYNNNNQCNVKDFITPMMYLIVASSVEIALAGLTILPAVMDAVQGAKIARNHLHVPSTGIATASLALQAVNFLLLIFLGVWAGFGGWSFWHSNQGCGPRDLYLFLWAFLIVEMALVAFRLLTTASAGIAALTQLLTGKRAERREAAIEGEKVPEYNNYNGAGQQYGAHNNQYLDETRPVSPAPVANTNYAANTIEAPVSGYNQHHTILVDPATTRAY